MAKHMVKCSICGEQFDASTTPFVKTSSTRYAHQSCALSAEALKTKEEKDKEALDKYLLKLFNTKTINQKIKKQINQYITDYEYTYSGIHKALIYFYEIKGNSIEKSNGGIGIVPYVYQNAYNYYYSLWQAQQKNEQKVVEEYKPVVREIVIERPKRNVKKRNLFAFLDEEGND